ncbi:hypothetical protein NB545_15745 [Vibrio campbellii]|uniref:hypothetical protein n=1 Tax=Vibrio campbellii TaxID=680 RepID=UPI00215C308C|nr:hypothetical protein [Vibrio campbellii]MCR9908906.1 hypothetical protein [Vibrio campbellii]
MEIDNYRLRVLIGFLGCSTLFLVLLSPGSITSVVGLLGSMLSLLLVPLITLSSQLNNGKTLLTYSSRNTKVIILISFAIFLSILITSWQAFSGMGSITNFFDLTKFINILCPFMLVTLMKKSDVDFLDKYAIRLFTIYLFLTILLILMQNISPGLSLWRFISESTHYKHLDSRPFGLNGSPTQAAFAILFVSFFFFVRKKYYLFLLSGICLFLVQNKLTLLVFVAAILYILLSSKLSKLVKIILVFIFAVAVLYVVSISAALASFVFDSSRLVESNTYTHRMDLLFIIIDRVQDWNFLLFGLPDKQYWAEEFGAFDMMYALVIFRFGALFFIFFLLMLIYIASVMFKGKNKILCTMFIFGTSFTMIGLFHSRYGILCSWIIALSFWYISSQNTDSKNKKSVNV